MGLVFPDKPGAKTGKKSFRLSPPQIVVMSFAAMILTGAILLNLPISSQDGRSVGFLNALFTATSANCVTGLVVVTTASHWTWFGKAVILLLIQLGGLGFISMLTLGMVIFGQQISLRSRLLIQASFNQEGLGGMVRFVKHVLFITLMFEGIGAILLSISFFFMEGIPLGLSLVYGVFHSISAFCNAGFDILGPESLIPYNQNYMILSTVMLLIISGGLGFPVWSEIFYRKKHKPVVNRRRQRPLSMYLKQMSLHSKMAIYTTLTLILSGAVLFSLLEWNNPQTLGGMSLPHKLFNVFFQSITLRTCGFDTIGQGGLTDTSQFFSSLYMMIGGSPASTAGGMKSVTVAVIFVAMVSVMKGRSKVEAFGRTLPADLLQKCLSVMATMILVVFTSSFILHFTEMNNPFSHGYLELLFECASAAGTVGLTSGITPHLSAAGKMVIIVCMFMGRLSPVTVAIALNMRTDRDSGEIGYPDERVVIG